MNILDKSLENIYNILSLREDEQVQNNNNQNNAQQQNNSQQQSDNAQQQNNNQQQPDNNQQNNNQQQNNNNQQQANTSNFVPVNDLLKQLGLSSKEDLQKCIDMALAARNNKK